MGLGLVNLHDFHVGLIQATKRDYMNSWDYSPSPQKNDKGTTEEKEKEKMGQRVNFEQESWNVMFSNVSSFGSS
jgi:hypothetical protein